MMNTIELTNIHEVNYEAQDDFFYIGLFVSYKYGEMGMVFTDNIVYSSKTQILGLYGCLNFLYNGMDDVCKKKFIDYLQTEFNIRVDSIK